MTPPIDVGAVPTGSPYERFKQVEALLPETEPLDPAMGGLRVVQQEQMAVDEQAAENEEMAGPADEADTPVVGAQQLTERLASMSMDHCNWPHNLPDENEEIETPPMAQLNQKLEEMVAHINQMKQRLPSEADSDLAEPTPVGQQALRDLGADDAPMVGVQCSVS